MTENDLFALNETAFYTFDIMRLKERIRFIKSFMPANVSLCYAVKANPFIIKETASEFKHFEICSPGEAAICGALKIPSNHMVISGVYKTPAFIEKTVKDPNFDGVITVESMTQYQFLRQFSCEAQNPVRILIRLTNNSQFGINASDIETIIQDLKKQAALHCIGIQYFSGTQKTSLKKLKREISYLDEFLIHLKDECHFEAEYLEYGPGFPVAYFDTDEFDEENYLITFSRFLEDMTCKTKIVLELGRSITAGCGNYYTHVVDIKNNKGQNYALVDGGMHHIVYYGQHMAMKRPKLRVVGKEIVNPNRQWTICGSLCSMNDILVKQITLPEIKIGDLLCFENTGAYCMTEGIALFLSRDIPAVYLILEDGSWICVRESYETSHLNIPNYERN